ncbi:hypothetical protein PV773_03835 [Mesorhizobium sp. CC13]|uniref:glycine-rich domain-containing protein n=1 Tax=Mesorhizobium sp. CC13 TaxID=3029194 RepID=UPI00326328AA
MNDLTNPELWNKIASYNFDDPLAEAPFSARLALENSWTAWRAKTVVDEYRRFIYLVCVSDELLSPSPEIDKAWHLHLTYTKDYWKRFCGETLGREVHHYPSSGPTDSQGSLREAYARTLSLLASEFGKEPVTAIWPEASVSDRGLSTGTFALPPTSNLKDAIPFSVAMVLIGIGISLLWSNGLIDKVAIVALSVVGIIVAGILFLPNRRRRKDQGEGCGGGCGGSNGGDGGGCGGGD